jgi:transposase
MVFKWRRYLLAGKFGVATPQQAMLPVTIIEAESNISPAKTKRPRLPDAAPVPDGSVVRPGVIEIQIADASVRFDGQADLAAVRAVVRMLRS